MKISIITPVFNDLRVGRALDSILSQRHEHEIELVVMDAGSTDGTLELLQSYRDRIAVLSSEPDEGIFDGMNKGIRRATGDVVGILNADDEYRDTRVIQDVADIFVRKDVDACYGDLVYVNEADRVVRYWKTGEFRRSKWYRGWVPPHPTFFVRRHVYERYGLFDLNYPVAADYELMLRFMLRHEIRARYLQRVLVSMATGGNANKSISKVVRGNAEIVQAWRRNGLHGGFLVPVLKFPNKFLQFVFSSKQFDLDRDRSHQTPKSIRTA